MDHGVYFWISIVSFVVNIGLTMAGVGLWVANRKEKERRNAQVKIWMQGANGLSEALQRIIQDRWANLYTSVQDVVNAVNAVHASAFAQYQSLYEERTITEDEWKKEQADLRTQLRAGNQQEAAKSGVSEVLTVAEALEIPVNKNSSRIRKFTKKLSKNRHSSK